jgi:hypothetical protein
MLNRYRDGTPFCEKVLREPDLDSFSVLRIAEMDKTFKRIVSLSQTVPVKSSFVSWLG